MKYDIRIFLLLLIPLLAGCQNQAETQAYEGVDLYYSGAFDEARAAFDPIAKQTNGDFVLNNARLGSCALAEYHMTDAESAFLRAYEVINSVGVNNGGRSIGATIVSENIKVWKGEPFERAMVNFYLGQIYYMKHDYGNARAAFENALFKLRDYGDAKDPDKYNDIDSDFTLGYLMLGKAWQRLGETDKAQANFARVASLRPDLATLAGAPLNQDANLLLIVDWGRGPAKLLTADGSVAGFFPQPNRAGPIFLPRVLVDGSAAPTDSVVGPPIDMLAIAQDRRWEDIDTIRVIKDVAGYGLMGAGVYELNRGGRGNEWLGAGLLAGGALLKASATADVRYWEMLPRTTFVIPLKVAPGAHQITVAFSDGQQQTWNNLVAPAKDDNTYYLRVLPGTPGPYTFPPPGSDVVVAPPPGAPAGLP